MKNLIDKINAIKDTTKFIKSKLKAGSIPVLDDFKDSRDIDYSNMYYMQSKKVFNSMIDNFSSFMGNSEVTFNYHLYSSSIEEEKLFLITGEESLFLFVLPDDVNVSEFKYNRDGNIHRLTFKVTISV